MEVYKKKTNTGDDVFIRIQPRGSESSSPPPPTALVLGWLASKPKNVSKYTLLYEQMGYNTIQTTASFSVVFPISPRYSAKYLLSLLRILASDDRLTAGGLVIHMFSNAGAINAPHLSKMFSGGYPDVIKADDEFVVKKTKDAIAATVFDSGPVYLHNSLGARAINLGLGFDESIIGVVIRILFTLLCWLQRILLGNVPRNFWDGLRKAQYLSPELYIFSHVDQLMDVSSLEALIEERKQAGHNVRKWDVNDADHVSILRAHPEEYIQTIHAVNEWGINAWRNRASLPSWTSTSDS